jgi:hypothetical protein
MRKTLNKTLLALLAGCASLGMHAAEAQACSNQDCAWDYETCYKHTGARWCQVTYGYNPPFGRWTPINTYDHSSLGSAPEQARQAFNYPANGPSNSIYLYTDGKSHANHDIDYWNTYSSSWWWGETSFPYGLNGGGCIPRGGGMIVFNTGQMHKMDAVLRRMLANHETGHAVGLGHSCNCPHVMNPCLECYSSALSYCDGQGVRALYH